MLRNILFLAIRETRFLLRGREVYFFTFAMPVAFMYFIGTVTSQSNNGGMTSNDPIAVQSPADAGFLADQLIARLQREGLAIERTESAEASHHVRRVIIPERFTERVLDGEKMVVKLVRKDDGLAADYDRYRVSRAVYTVLADLIVCAKTGETVDAAAFERLQQMPRALTLKVRPAGNRPKIPTGFEQAVPGILIMFTLMSLLSGGSVSLVIERRQGLLRRLASAPISRIEVFVGKWLGRLALGIVQILFCMIVGTWLFGMDWGPDLPMVVAVLFAWGALSASFGMMLGNFARTEGQGIGIAVLATNGFAALGGLWWPVEITPGWMQTFAKCLPTGWAMDAMHQLVSFRAGPAAALPQLAALLIATLLVAWLGARTFRFQ